MKTLGFVSCFFSILFFQALLKFSQTYQIDAREERVRTNRSTPLRAWGSLGYFSSSGLRKNKAVSYIKKKNNLKNKEKINKEKSPSPLSVSVSGDAGMLLCSINAPSPAAVPPGAPAVRACSHVRDAHRHPPSCAVVLELFKAIFQQKKKHLYLLGEKQACSEINISFVSKRFTIPLINLITAEFFCIETTP